jgi:hypothetical protein
MQTATVSFHFPRPSAPALFVLLTFAAAIGCGGSEVGGGDSPEPSATGGAGSSPAQPIAPAPSQGAASSTGGQTPADPPSSAPAMPNPAPSEGNTTPASVDATGVGAACAQVDTSDACGACVCRECGAELDTCANTPGCPQILACVRENGCSGTDCFCGDASLPRCFDGEGDGPCKDAVLAAPGGREPSLDDPSGGPASDAALEVGECADDDDGCSDVCDVGL